MPGRKPTVFISYSHKDEKWKNRLRPHLNALERVAEVCIWDDHDISAGSNWYNQIEKAMNRAIVSVCLISADYLASDFCQKEEIPYQFKRTITGGTDSGAIHQARGGVPSVTVSVPVRYIHAPVSMMRLSDFENTVELMHKTLGRMTEL